MNLIEDQELNQRPLESERSTTATRTAIYEIFVDRFAADNGLQLEPPPPGASPSDYHCGGTLSGITARLDYIQKLGIDAIYLTPIFRAKSNHKYNTASFDEVEPRFGGEEAFSSLAAECRQRQMGLILDGVFNHVGTDHRWFEQRAAQNEEILIKRNGSAIGYSCWRGHKSLPELNLASTEVQQTLFDGDDAVIRKWIRKGATGWRLDCANDIGSTICAKARQAVREEHAPDGVTGEIMSYAEEWLAGASLDGVMNYYFRETVLGLVSGTVPVVQAAYNMKRMAKRYNPAALLRSWNILSSHDTPRLATVIPDANKRRLAQTLAFVYPGIPMIYYGDEVGMKGGPDPDCRKPMLWNESAWDLQTMDHLHVLARLRNTHPALKAGIYLPMPQPAHPGILAFARTTNQPQELVIILVNASDEAFTGKIFVPYSYMFDGLKLHDLLNGIDPVDACSGSLSVTVPPWSAALLTPDDSVPGYSFFRGRSS